MQQFCHRKKRLFRTQNQGISVSAIQQVRNSRDSKLFKGYGPRMQFPIMWEALCVCGLDCAVASAERRQVALVTQVPIPPWESCRTVFSSSKQVLKQVGPTWSEQTIPIQVKILWFGQILNCLSVQFNTRETQLMIARSLWIDSDFRLSVFGLSGTHLCFGSIWEFGVWTLPGLNAWVLNEGVIFASGLHSRNILTTNWAV